MTKLITLFTLASIVLALPSDSNYFRSSSQPSYFSTQEAGQGGFIGNIFDAVFGSPRKPTIILNSPVVPAISPAYVNYPGITTADPYPYPYPGPYPVTYPNSY
jgi:hypothetical protein